VLFFRLCVVLVSSWAYAPLAAVAKSASAAAEFRIILIGYASS
jgi:hypothetical protein